MFLNILLKTSINVFIFIPLEKMANSIIFNFLLKDTKMGKFCLNWPKIQCVLFIFERKFFTKSHLKSFIFLEKGIVYIIISHYELLKKW